MTEYLHLASDVIHARRLMNNSLTRIEETLIRLLFQGNRDRMQRNRSFRIRRSRSVSPAYRRHSPIPRVFSPINNSETYYRRPRSTSPCPPPIPTRRNPLQRTPPPIYPRRLRSTSPPPLLTNPISRPSPPTYQPPST